MSSSRTKRTQDETPGDEHPLQSWKSLPKEVPQLKCNEHSLSASGSFAALASRLYAFFHEEPAVQDNHSEEEENLVRSLMSGIQQLVRDELSRRHTKGSSSSQPQSQNSKSKSKDHRTSTEDNVQQPGPSKGHGQAVRTWQFLPVVQGQVWILLRHQTPQTVVKKDRGITFHTLTCNNFAKGKDEHHKLLFLQYNRGR